jgi:predicted site-specific integrase-resolvase
VAGFGLENLHVALAAHSRRIVVVMVVRGTDDLVRGMKDVLVGMCARLYSLPGARGWRAVTAAKHSEPEAG